MGLVYLDNAASTRPAAEVVDLMARVAREQYSNPSAAHAGGAEAARLLNDARAEIAAVLGGMPNEIVFTSGGTEANALALWGVAGRARGRHVVVSAIEHPAVLRNVERLVAGKGKAGRGGGTSGGTGGDGFEVTLVPPDACGIVSADAVAAAVRADTVLVAVMLVNNELGTVQPLADIARALAATPPGDRGGKRPHLHVDAVQGFGLLPFAFPFPLRPAQLGADSLAISAHKLHGPKGVGALWVRAGASLAPLWEGGGQEGGTRAGSENVPGIVGFARAATLAAQACKDGTIAGMAALRDHLEARVGECVPAARPTVRVSPAARAPHISSLSLPGLPAEPLLHALGARGVMASAGSACGSKVRGPSHVLKAIGVDDSTAVLRFSLSRDTTREEIELAAAALAAAVAEIGASVKPVRRQRP